MHAILWTSKSTAKIEEESQQAEELLRLQPDIDLDVFDADELQPRDLDPYKSLPLLITGYGEFYGLTMIQAYVHSLKVLIPRGGV